LLAVVGSVALVLAVVALVTGSLTVLSLLVVAFVLLWAVSTLRHVRHAPWNAGGNVISKQCSEDRGREL
jgi:hypothetical protein